MHRIGRCGRFGDRGVALNIIEDPSDDNRLTKIINKYKMDITELLSIDNLKKVVKT